MQRDGSGPDRPGNGSAGRLVIRHRGLVTPEDRVRRLEQRGCVVWFTGLSGSGKSTLAHALERRLFDDGGLAYVLDGDNVRHGLNRDLGFSAADREENIRRIGEVAALFADAGVIALVAFISPYAGDRQRAREAAGAERFVEVFLDAPLAVCEERDPKGLYRKARAGELDDFTGISAPYEPPARPDLVIDTGCTSLDASVDRVLACLAARGLGRAGADPGVAPRGTARAGADPGVAADGTDPRAAQDKAP